MTEQGNPTINRSRRNFIKGMVGIAGGAAVAAVTEAVPFLQLPEEKPITVDDIKFQPMWNVEQKPFVDTLGNYFDLSTSQFVSNQSVQDSLLLSDLPAFDEWRDSKVTPDLIMNNNKFNTIKEKTYKKLDIWITGMSKKTNSSSSESTVSSPNFTPSELLVMRQINHAVAQTLVYDKQSPVKFSELSLSERLDLGYTNCFEYTLALSMAYAHSYTPEVAGIPTNIGYYKLRRTDKKTGEKVNESHVFNIINHNNTCVVADITMFGSELMTFSEYIDKLAKGGIRITSPIEFTSIIANNSYRAFPYEDNNWLAADTPLSLPASYDPAIAQQNQLH